jgi:hypothetical protein
MVSMADQATLIPPTDTVRVELARCAREHRRLRSLLRLAKQAEEDRKFVQGLQGQAPGLGRPMATGRVPA